MSKRYKKSEDDNHKKLLIVVAILTIIDKLIDIIAKLYK